MVIGDVLKKAGAYGWIDQYGWYNNAFIDQYARYSWIFEPECKFLSKW